MTAKRDIWETRVLKEEFRYLTSKFDEIKVQERNNDKKRMMYHKLERLYEKIMEKKKKIEEDTSMYESKVMTEIEEYLKLIDDYEAKNLTLEPCHFPSKSKSPFLYYLYSFDMFVRAMSLVFYMVFLGLYIFPLMCVVTPTLDFILRNVFAVPEKYQLFHFFKQASSYFLLVVLGVFVTVEGNVFDGNCSTYGRNPLLICFQHSSNLDAFPILAFFPQYFRSIGKSDVFLIPYIAWMSFLFGILPINRKNRELAIKQMDRGTNSLRNGTSLALSPEGTRSTTGQLLRFKKGPFYAREQASTSENNIPILPLLILGTYELWPPNYKFACAGQCKIKFLEKLEDKKDDDLSTREAWSRRLRDKMMDGIDLEITETSLDKRIDGRPLTWLQRIKHELVLVTFWSLFINTNIQLRNLLGCSSFVFWFGVMIYSCIVTALIYFGFAKKKY